VDELRREKGDGAADDAKWRFERSGIYEGALGRTEVAKLRTPALKKWRTDLLTEDDEDRQMTKAGANRMMTSLRAALNLAVKNKRVSTTAAPTWGDVEQYKNADGRRGDEHFLSLEQRRALLAAAKGSVHDLIEAALLIGARPGELVKATRGNFDARTKTLKLSHRKGDGTVRERDVPLTGLALTLYERLAKSKLPTALLLTRDGQPWTRIEWSRQIRAAAEAAVVKDAKGNVLKDDKDHVVTLPPGVCLYSCRHTYISQAIMDGLTTLDVAKLTGTSLAMIDKHYGKYVKDAVRERLAKVRML
jgi:integrase